MPAGVLTAFEPRKTPVQVRSTVTVEAISEAAIQVLLTHGADRLTTTRVADRAGISVAALYQYYPNKRSLLFAVFEDLSRLPKHRRRGASLEGPTTSTAKGA